MPKISTTEAILLISFALLADLINWIPLVNLIVTFFTLPAFQFYFYLKGVRGIYSLIGNLIEIIPFLSILPGITVGIIATILIADKMPLVAKKIMAK